MGSKKQIQPFQLPVDVWQQIATFLPTKDWVKLSGINQMTFTVQPERILLSGLTAQSLEWVQRRWGEARGLNIEADSMELPWVMDHQASSPSNLLEFRVAVKEKFSSSCATFLTWLLAHSPALRLLSLVGKDTFVLPPLTNLRHLRLYADSFENGTLASLGHLRNLRTLSLVQYEETEEMAELSLASLPDLADVFINGVALAGISLPRACRLHVVVWEARDFREWWSDVASRGCLVSFTVNQEDTNRGGIPDFVTSSRCQSLRWILGCLGTEGYPANFQTALFPCLRELYLNGDDVKILLPSTMLLQKLHVSAQDLIMDSESPDRLANSLQDFSVTYRTVRGSGVFQVAMALSRAGKSLNVVNARLLEEGFAGLYLNNFYEFGADWPCACGTCHECLVSSRETVGKYLPY